MSSRSLWAIRELLSAITAATTSAPWKRSLRRWRLKQSLISTVFAVDQLWSENLTSRGPARQTVPCRRADIGFRSPCAFDHAKLRDERFWVHPPRARLQP